MADSTNTTVTVLGLGAMGQALAAALRKGDRPTTVWNRTPGKDAALVSAGATSAPSARAAVQASDLIIVVLLDHASVHTILDPVAADLKGKQLLNLTSTTPDEARELAVWAAEHGIDYLDGGIMAVPPMIGQIGASILYSGSQPLFEQHRETLELFADTVYFGTDAGVASTYDFALLSAMYAMFGGFMHGAAMVRSVGVTAADFAERAVAWITAMAQVLPAFGRIIDSGDYTNPVQSIAFHKAALDAINRASRETGTATDLVAPLKNLLDRQVADGHGALGFDRTFEELV
ncbi:NAD(P)-dependent oxidoreductase [Nocardia altamirensis]|uniref:NAD(P)-dependent oxidoreductase n=1 Tax=Nocardia altamirensis TaxID=472158 RepID=UPI000840259D|nr:NAD(P)-binding domain-containing protein [Nocardia altamirensis]